MQSPDIRSLAPVPIPLPRGVHSYVEQPSGETVYLAMTSAGELLNGERRRRYPDETDAMVRDDMWRDLDRQDPLIGRPRLSVSDGGRCGLSRLG